jgi:hypothetical protein
MMAIAIMSGLTVATIPTISFRDTVQLIEVEAVRSGRIEKLLSSARAADATNAPQPHFRRSP